MINNKQGNRDFIPGSEWVYFKLYTGTKTADAILKNETYGYVKEMLDRQTIDKWFFIRYSDPDFHIRLRLHLKETRDFSCVFNRFFETFLPAVDAGLVWNVQCDTYQREMERYGANTISMIEDIFFIDSEFIVRLLCQLDEENPEQHRWKLALVLIDSILSAFSFDIPQRKELLLTMADNYKKEFGFTNHPPKKQLDEKFRIFRKDIANVLLWENGSVKPLDTINARKQAISPIAKKLMEMGGSGAFEISLDSLLMSVIHMTMNRWFRSKSRLHELVIYDFMARHYTNHIAKEKYNKK